MKREESQVKPKPEAVVVRLKPRCKKQAARRSNVTFFDYALTDLVHSLTPLVRVAGADGAHPVRKRPLPAAQTPDAKRLRAHEALKSLEYTDAVYEKRSHVGKREREAALKYAAALWRLINEHRLHGAHVGLRDHNCVASQCRHTRLKVEVWRAKPSEHHHRPMHSCLASVDGTRNLCAFGHLFQRPYSQSHWENDHRVHVCLRIHQDGRERVWCEYQRSPGMHVGNKPRQIIDHLYMCETTGKLHLCNTDHCVYTSSAQDTPSCPVSGLMQARQFVTHFYRGKGNHGPSDSMLAYRDLVNRTPSFETLLGNLMATEHMSQIVSLYTRFFVLRKQHTPDMLLRATAIALLRLLDCEELMHVRYDRQRREMLATAKLVDIQIGRRVGQDHKGVVSLVDIVGKIDTAAMRHHIPRRPADAAVRRDIYHQTADVAVKIWFLLHRFPCGAVRLPPAAALVGGELLALPDAERHTARQTSALQLELDVAKFNRQPLSVSVTPSRNLLAITDNPEKHPPHPGLGWQPDRRAWCGTLLPEQVEQLSSNPSVAEVDVFRQLALTAPPHAARSNALALASSHTSLALWRNNVIFPSFPSFILPFFEAVKKGLFVTYYNAAHTVVPYSATLDEFLPAKVDLELLAGGGQQFQQRVRSIPELLQRIISNLNCQPDVLDLHKLSFKELDPKLLAQHGVAKEFITSAFQLLYQATEPELPG